MRCFVRTDLRLSDRSTAWRPILAPWSMSPSSRWLIAIEVRLNERLRAYSSPKLLIALDSAGMAVLVYLASTV